MRYAHVAELLFNRPLMITEAKLTVLQQIFCRRAGIDVVGLPAVEAVEVSEKDRRAAGYSAQNGIGTIGVYGPLMHRRLASEYPSGGPTTYSEIWNAFDLALADDAVQGIVLDIDSPGGEVNGVFDLADHIFSSRGIKPITAVVNESAYSAAYLLASAAEKIVIPRTGGAGSIGVIATHADLSRLEDAAGITVTHVFAGARKADFSQHQPLSADAAAVLQGLVDDSYALFVDTVARNRGMKSSDVRATEAGIFEGKKAVSAGLADQVAPANKAIAGARKGRGTRLVAASTQEEVMNLKELKENYPEIYQAAFEEGKASVETPDVEKIGAAAKDAGVAAERARCVEILEGAASAGLTLAAVKDGTEPGAFFKAALQAEREGRDAALTSLGKGLEPPVGGSGKQAAKVEDAGSDAQKSAEFTAKVAEAHKERGGKKSDAMASVIAKHPDLHQAWLREQQKR